MIRVVVSDKVQAELTVTQSRTIDAGKATASVWYFLPGGARRWRKPYHQGTLTLIGLKLSLHDSNNKLVWQVGVSDLKSVRVISTVITFRFADNTSFDVSFRNEQAAAKWIGPRGSPFYLMGVDAALKAMEPFLIVFRQQDLVKRVSWVIPIAILVAIIILSIVGGLVLK
jgi:hypothetical protein